jgi:hypothetical protein
MEAVVVIMVDHLGIAEEDKETKKCHSTFDSNRLIRLYYRRGFQNCKTPLPEI